VAESDAGGTRLRAEVAEQRTHHERRQHERRHGERGFRGQRGSEARAQKLQCDGLDAFGAPQPGGAEQAGHGQASQQAVAQVAAERGSQPPLVGRGTHRRPDEVDREQHGEGVDGVLRHLAEHPHHEHFVADAQQAGGGQQQRHAAGHRPR
jgi:hypothetical protein